MEKETLKGRELKTRVGQTNGQTRNRPGRKRLNDKAKKGSFPGSFINHNFFFKLEVFSESGFQ